MERKVQEVSSRNAGSAVRFFGGGGGGKSGRRREKKEEIKRRTQIDEGGEGARREKLIAMPRVDPSTRNDGVYEKCRSEKRKITDTHR
jgi:hypothetical protein